VRTGRAAVQPPEAGGTLLPHGRTVVKSPAVVHGPGRRRSVAKRVGHACEEGVVLRYIPLLAALPFLGILVGIPLLNRVMPLVLGLPLVLAWLVLWILLTSAIMAVVYMCDPASKRGERR
jgi:hypothetical protein